MNAIDQQVLEFCLEDFRPLKPLARTTPSGTLYRHVKRLVRLAWLTKEGNLYRTTDTGRRQLVAVATGRSWNTLERLYPPLELVPTPVHQGLVELIWAAMVARQHAISPERHPFFVASGSTLRWKTSLGRFLCHAIGLDPAVQVVRRALLANLDAVPLPDLATVGERAIEAARTHPPLVLPAPRTDIRDLHDAIVDRIRGVLLPSAHERIDVEIVANLCAGMTALIPEPVPAVAQVLNRVGILAETFGWARPGWIDVVSDFGSATNSARVGTSGFIAQQRLPETLEKKAASEPVVSLAVSPPRLRPRTSVPGLDLSEALRARLIWFAMETQQDVEDALTTLLDLFLEWRESGASIEMLAAILRLGERLELAGVEVDTLRGFLEALEQLRKEGCDFGDVPEARRVIGMLGMLPFSWTWEQAESAMQDVATVLEQGIELADVTRFLEQHRRLEALGFGEPTAVAVAEALGRAGALGERRDAVLSALIETAGSQADLDALVAEHQRLEAAVNELAATEQRWQTAVQQHREHVERLKGAVARLSETQNRLQAERDEAADSLAVANALRAFLMGRTAEAESLWTSLDGLLSWRKRGGRADDAVGHIFTEAIHRKILAFFQKLNQELPRK